MTSLISIESPAEMFKELIEEALDHQGIETSQDSTFYLVDLLESFVRSDSRIAKVGSYPGQPLAELLLSANEANPASRVPGLRFTGDLALFLVGFLADGLRHDVAGTKYYVRVGGSAYGVLARSSANSGAASVFDELATHFIRFADVLSEVSESCSLTDDSDLLRLYERWTQTGSRRSAQQLRSHGILVVPSSDAVH